MNIDKSSFSFNFHASWVLLLTDCVLVWNSQRNNKVVNVLLNQIQNTRRCRIRWERSFTHIQLYTYLFSLSHIKTRDCAVCEVDERQWSGKKTIECAHSVQDIIRKRQEHQGRRQELHKISGKPIGQLFQGKWPPGYPKQSKQKIKDWQREREREGERERGRERESESDKMDNDNQPQQKHCPGTVSSRLLSSLNPFFHAKLNLFAQYKTDFVLKLFYPQYFDVGHLGNTYNQKRTIIRILVVANSGPWDRFFSPKFKQVEEMEDTRQMKQNSQQVILVLGYFLMFWMKP